MTVLIMFICADAHTWETMPVPARQVAEAAQSAESAIFELMSDLEINKAMKRTHQSSNGFKTKKPSPAPHRTLRPADRPEPRTSWGSLEGSHWEAKGKKGNHSFTPANSETNLATMAISSECAATLTLDSSTRRANGFQRGPAPPPPVSE